MKMNREQIEDAIDVKKVIAKINGMLPTCKLKQMCIDKCTKQLAREQKPDNLKFLAKSDSLWVRYNKNGNNEFDIWYLSGYSNNGTYYICSNYLQLSETFNGIEPGSSWETHIEHECSDVFAYKLLLIDEADIHITGGYRRIDC